MVRAGLQTALGNALTFASLMLDQQAQCWQHTIDVSGDGENNIGVTPAEVCRLLGFDRIAVNALVVTEGRKDPVETAEEGAAMLDAYYRDSIIHGANAFTMIAAG